ncbi:MAG: hypothetical protein AMXMBFR58_23490 [Phycisphaerae bacterium]|nr:hypothetical protein [Phycisphaerales bacterium]MCK6476857.1 hypothetical protein [Phycisphaerales bacterium]
MRLQSLQRWLSVSLFGLLVILQLACLPFYSGSSITRNLSWRLEHGRLTLKRSPVDHTESFYIAGNSEGLRWRSEFKRFGPGDFRLTVPLWMPLALMATWSVVAWLPRTAAPPPPAEPTL